MAKIRGVDFPSDIFEGLLAFARHMHPQEALLLLRGKISAESLRVEEFLIPPFAVQSEDFASFSPWFLPLDPSILGTVHSHPSGSLKPSTEDFNHFYGRVMVIVAYPYHSKNNVAAYDKDGRSLPVRLL